MHFSRKELQTLSQFLISHREKILTDQFYRIEMTLCHITLCELLFKNVIGILNVNVSFFLVSPLYMSFQMSVKNSWIVHQHFFNQHILPTTIQSVKAILASWPSTLRWPNSLKFNRPLWTVPHGTGRTQTCHICM